jgi:hypothetical protein
LAESLGLDTLRAEPPFATLDELYRFARWKTLLKGFLVVVQSEVCFGIADISRQLPLYTQEAALTLSAVSL